MPMLLTRPIKVDPPETTTQSATEHRSRLKDRTQDVHKHSGAQNPTH